MTSAEIELSEEERLVFRSMLLTHRMLGTENPLIPLMSDADGDGKHDFYGLDENDEVVFVSGVTLEDSVFESDPEEDEESLEEVGSEIPEDVPEVLEDPNRGAV